MDNMRLVDKLNYYVEHSTHSQLISPLFSEKEWLILNTVHDFENLRITMAQDTSTKSGIESTLQRMEKEKEISFQLKQQFINQIDCLLAQESIEAWLDILTWYQWLDAKQLLHRFWEFHILKIVLDIFISELKAFSNNESTVSVLTLHSMEEIANTYFSILFLLRRIEYDIEPVDAITDSVKKFCLSPIFIHHIIKKAKIYNKEKVSKVITNWWEKGT